MRRREVIALLGGAAAAWPLGARAQPVPIPVVGFLGSGSLASDAYRLAGFRRGLRELGYREGQNVAIEYRWAGNDYSRLPELATDLASRPVVVIVAEGGLASALAAKAATSTIPIVFAIGADPIKFGLVETLNRPGGNLTGVSFLLNALGAKRLELLRAVVPSALVVGLLMNPSNPAAEPDREEVLAVARVLGQRVHVVTARSERDFDDAFASLARERATALIVSPDAVFTSGRDQLVALAGRARLPTIYHMRELTEAGGLMSYGTNMLEAHHQVGLYTGRLLNGGKPSELPVHQSTKFEFVINLKAAKTLGVAIPDNLLALADDIVE
ncbi:MAG: ABC transporter substrate-binding protein [Xanthobacteraceae bacterium]